MTCPKCGRVGDCRTCCCVNIDHRNPRLTECRLCGHPTRGAKS